jgi:hypothetical protein
MILSLRERPFNLKGGVIVKNKYSNSRVVRKIISLNETKKHNPPYKLNGRSLNCYVLQIRQLLYNTCSLCTQNTLRKGVHF